MHPSPGATHAVRRAVRAAMLCETGQPARWRVPQDIAHADFLGAARRQRVVPVLAAQVAELALPETIAVPLVSERDSGRLSSMLQIRELARISALFTAARLPFLAFKGPALAMQTTGDFTARGHGDLDLLVHPRQVATAHEVLLSAGWLPRPPFPRPGASWAWRHLMHTSYELPLDGPHSSVDLHWRLDPTRHALPPFEVVWGRHVRVRVGEVEVPTLAARDAFQHTCSHAGKDDWRWLRSLVDVHRLARLDRVPQDGPLRRVDLMTLAVTHATIGLPDSVYAGPRTRAARHAPAIRIARRSQERPPPGEEVRAPAVGLPNAVRRNLRGSRYPSDLVRVLYGVALPAAHGPAGDARALTAIPRAVVNRGKYGTRRLRAWAGDR